MFLYIKRMIICLVAVIFSTTVSAQSTAGATASATIMTDPDLSISEKINFDNITVNTATKESKLINNYKMIAAYTISDYSFSVTLPEIITLSGQDGYSTISAVLYLEKNCNETSDNTLVIGALFNTGLNLSPGKYTSAPYNITVNYN